MSTMAHPHGGAEEEKEITIRDLYPDLSEEQLKEAEENLHRYLGVVREIYENTRRLLPEIFDKLDRFSYH